MAHPDHTFWMVLGNGVPTVRHQSQESAEREAERLADLNPGHSFFVLQALTRHDAVRVHRTVLDEMPF